MKGWYEVYASDSGHPEVARNEDERERIVAISDSIEGFYPSA